MCSKKMHGFWVFCVCIVLVFALFGVAIESSSSPEELQPYRTGFHFQPPKNWMNDPNGPMYYKNVYHLFYQYNPYGPLWGNISWGHSVSNDLVNWIHLPTALDPKEPYDVNGCLSGSATVVQGDLPVILYTGQDVNNSQVQNMATPKDISDPWLREWTKSPRNPLLLPVDGINPKQFRDPSTAWNGSDGLWRIVIGGEIEGQGTALLYKSRDAMNWSRSPNPLHFSSKTGMWECPDFYPVHVTAKRGLDNSVQGSYTKHVLKASFNNHEYYIIGSYDIKKDKLGALKTDFMDEKTQLRYDYGRFYASKSFYDGHKQRRVLWAWINEGDSQTDDVKRGWSGLQSFPRSILLSENGTQLVQWPVEELESLRTGEVKIENKELQSGSILEIQNIKASQADVQVSFSLSNLNEAEVISSDTVDPQLLCTQKNASVGGNVGPFGLLVLASNNLTEQTAVFFRVFKAPDKFVVLMCSDQSRSSLKQDVDKAIYGAFLDLDPRSQEISLRSLIDHSIIESFGGQGKVCITARVYPTLAINQHAQLHAFNNGKQCLKISSLSAWSIKNVQMKSLV